MPAENDRILYHQRIRIVYDRLCVCVCHQIRSSRRHARHRWRRRLLWSAPISPHSTQQPRERAPRFIEPGREAPRLSSSRLRLRPATVRNVERAAAHTASVNSWIVRCSRALARVFCRAVAFAGERRSVIFVRVCVCVRVAVVFCACVCDPESSRTKPEYYLQNNATHSEHPSTPPIPPNTRTNTRSHALTHALTIQCRPTPLPLPQPLRVAVT